MLLGLSIDKVLKRKLRFYESVLFLPPPPVFPVDGRKVGDANTDEN